MTVKLNGSSSGYTAIDAPAAAGSNTLVLPADNGSANEVLKTDGSGNLDWVAQTVNTVDTGLPCFFATNESTGNWPASATPSRLDFSTTREDSGTDFSETAKFTPGTAGYYYVWCQVTMRFLDAAHAMQLYIYKNGSATGAMTYTNGRNSDYHNWVNQTVHGIVSCNGSSDYIEAYLANIPDSGTTTLQIQHRNFGAFRLGPN